MYFIISLHHKHASWSIGTSSIMKTVPMSQYVVTNNFLHRFEILWL